MIVIVREVCRTGQYVVVVMMVKYTGVEQAGWFTVILQCCSVCRTQDRLQN